MSNLYRKKPVVIEAVCWDGSQEAVEELGRLTGNAGFPVGHSGSIIIITLEGEMRAMPVDWIIKGVKGEFYPCKPDIFEATYEPA